MTTQPNPNKPEGTFDLAKEYLKLKVENESLKKAAEDVLNVVLRATSGTSNWDGKSYWTLKALIKSK